MCREKSHYVVLFAMMKPENGVIPLTLSSPIRETEPDREVSPT
jgi:hypothetical protein